MGGRVRDVVLSSDDAGAGFMAVCAHSLLKNWRGADPVRLNVLVGPGGLSAASRARLESVASRRAGTVLRYLDLASAIAPHEALLRPEGASRWNIFTWALVFAPGLVADAEGSLLYLDVDTLVNADVSPLFDLDLADAVLAVAYENHRGTRDDFEWREGVVPAEAERYFNDGLTVVNLAAYREGGFERRTIEWFAAHREIAWRLEQDALNAVCWDRVLALPPKWNFHDRYVRKFSRWDMSARYWAGNSPRECLEAAAEPAVLHFLGKKKPWRTCHRPYRRLYHEAMREVGLEPPREPLLAPLHDLLDALALRRIRRRLAGG